MQILRINKIKNWAYQFLRKTQKYTGTDNVYLAKGGFWLTLEDVVSAAASFLLALAFANLLNPIIYGNYRYVLSLIGTLGIFSLSGLGTTITQATARNFEESFYTGFKTKLKWGVLGSLIAIIGAAYYWIRGNHLLPIPLLVTAMFLPLMNASAIYLNFLEGRKLFNIRVKYSTISNIISAGTIIAAIFLTKNLFWLVASYLVSHTFLNYFFYLLTKKRFQPNKKEDSQTLSYGKHLSFMGAIGLLSSQIDRILLFTLIGPTQLATYYFSLAIPDQIRSATKSISTLAFPKLATKSPQEIKTNMKKKCWQLFFLANVVIFIYVIAAPYIYKIFFPQYLDSVLYSQIYIFSLLTLPLTLITTSFRAKVKQKELYILQSMLFLQIALLLLLIPFFGILGALTAILATKALSMVLILFLFRRF